VPKKLLTFILSGQVDRCFSFTSDTFIPSSFKISTDVLQMIWLIPSVLLMQASTSCFSFSTQAAEDAITA
jgi:hypothetical protein